jgi:RNA polymerase sigma-32 factor
MSEETISHSDHVTEAQTFHPLAVISQEEHLPAVSNPSLYRYLQEISQYELLSREETEELAIRFQESGDPDAAYRLVSSNLRLVVKVAMDFQKYWMQNFMDLIQEGNIGLVQATKKFDPYRGVKFSYYAAYWIRAYILKFIMDNWRLVKIGTTQTQRKLFFSLNKEKKLLEAQGFVSDVKLLAERLNVKESEIVEMGQRMDNWDISLEAPVQSDSDDEQKNFFPYTGPDIEDLVADQELRERVASILTDIDGLLNEKEKMILNTRLLSDEPETLQTIADQFAISRERVRQIEVNLLKKLRIIFEKELPDVRDFLDAEQISP